MISLEDKRLAKRLPFRQNLEYHITSKEVVREGRVKDGGGTLACDLSESGIRFWTEEFIPIHTPMDLRISLNPETKVLARGTVVWSQRQAHGENYQVGVSFAPALDAPSREILRNHLSRLTLQSKWN